MLIEVDCHCIKDMVKSRVNSNTRASSKEQVANMFTKHMLITEFSNCCNKLNMMDIYATAREEM